MIDIQPQLVNSVEKSMMMVCMSGTDELEYVYLSITALN